MKKSGQITVARARDIFCRDGGVLRTHDALRAGINPKTLYAMRDAGLLENLSRGLYRLMEVPLSGSIDLITVAHRIPKARICLISALSFHEITTQIPHEIHCAIPRNVSQPRIDHPPIRFFRFSAACYEAGIEYHEMNKTRVAVYSAEKTLADCFKYRNQIGMDTVLEALHYYRERKQLKVDSLLDHARTCRVYNILAPYLEAVL